MIKTAATILACFVSWSTIRPAMSGYHYVIIGFLVGQIALLATAYSMNRRQEPISISAALSLILGAIAGMCWPAAIFGFFLWLTLGKADAGRSAERRSA